jgi:type IV pilus assembly protein PilE
MTLIELLVVTSIIAILAAIAYPSYQRYVARTHRNAAAACLSQYAQFMERFYTTNLTYLNAAPVMSCRLENDLNRYYTFAVTIPDARTFVARATPVGAQATLDAACGALSLDQSGGRLPANNSCW